MKRLIIIVFLISLGVKAQDTLVLNTKLPFPTAYGPAAISTTTGGGTGTIYFVDNLDASEATSGSLKWAMNQASPKRIIPNVSGRVSYTSQYKDGRTQEEADDFTYYGHLAPQGGLEIYTGGMYYEYIKNIIVRGIKARGNVSDGDNLTFDRGENIIIDHASTAYSSGGESIDVSGNTTTPYSNGDITVQHSLVAQSGNGLIMGDSGGANSGGNGVFANIFVNVGWRFPKFGGDIDLDVYLNGIHNWTARMMRGDPYGYTVNEINNYYQKGSNTKNRPNDNLHKSYVVDTSPFPQIYSLGNVMPDTPPSGYPTDQTLIWQQVADPPIGFNDAVLPASHFTGTKHTRTWREFPELHSDSVKTMILDRAGATYYVSDAGVRGRYYDVTDQDAYDTFDLNTQEDNTSTTYVNPSIPTNTRGASYDADSDGLPDWFETAHGVSTTDEVKTYYTFTHYDTGATYVVQNTAGYGALDIFSAWVIQDFEFLLDVGEIAGDSTYSINSGGVVYGYTVTPTSGLVTTEAGGTDTFDVVLDTQPTTDVVFNITSNSIEGTVSAATLTFTNANWNTPQTITVTGQDDALQDGNIAYTVTVSVNAASSDDNFDALADVTVNLINTDDEGGGQTIPARGGMIKINGSWVRIKNN